MRIALSFTLAAMLASTFVLETAQAQDHPRSAEHPKKTEQPKAAEHPAATGDIVTVAAAAGGFKTLVMAIKAAGLVETLQGKGPFTVFAPTDDAFAKLPPETLQDLLKPENKEKLAAILSYHVVPGAVMASDVRTGMIKTVSGQELAVKVENGAVMVGQAKVLKADITATNGVIHVIDAVVLPADGAKDSAKPKDHPAR